MRSTFETVSYYDYVSAFPDTITSSIAIVATAVFPYFALLYNESDPMFKIYTDVAPKWLSLSIQRSGAGRRSFNICKKLLHQFEGVI